MSSRWPRAWRAQSDSGSGCITLLELVPIGQPESQSKGPEQRVSPQAGTPSTLISSLRATPQHGSLGATLQTSLHGHKRLNGVGVTSCCVGDYGAPNRSPPRVPPHLGVGQGGCRGDTGESEQHTSGLLERDLESHVAKPTQRPPSPHPAVGGRGSLGGRCWGGCAQPVRGRHGSSQTCPCLSVPRPRVQMARVLQGSPTPPRHGAGGGTGRVCLGLPPSSGRLK